MEAQDDFYVKPIQFHLLVQSYNFWTRISKNRHSGAMDGFPESFRIKNQLQIFLGNTCVLCSDTCTTGNVRCHHQFAHVTHQVTHDLENLVK